MAAHTAISELHAGDQKLELLGSCRPGLQNTHDTPFVTPYRAEQVVRAAQLQGWGSRCHRLLGAAVQNSWPLLINRKIAADPKSPQLPPSVSRREWVRTVVLRDWCSSETGNGPSLPLCPGAHLLLRSSSRAGIAEKDPGVELTDQFTPKAVAKISGPQVWLPIAILCRIFFF